MELGEFGDKRQNLEGRVRRQGTREAHCPDTSYGAFVKTGLVHLKFPGAYTPTRPLRGRQMCDEVEGLGQRPNP